MVSLLSWVQIADLHCDAGDTERWSFTLVLDALKEDVIALRAAEGPIDAVLVAGGVVGAGGGGDREARSFRLAREWLGDLAAAAGVETGGVFVVPGRGDVKTPASHPRRRSIARLIQRLRDGDERLDDAIADDDDRELLLSRLAAYLELAESFAPACLEPSTRARRLAWSHRMTGRRGLAVRFVGLSTSLLCEPDEGQGDDRGKLQIGVGQLGEALSSHKDGELCVVMSHHSFQDGWLADQGSVLGWIESRAHVHILGHAPEAGSVAAQRGGSRGLIRVTAGALNDRIGRTHRYAMSAVTLDARGALELRVWHRRWSSTRRCFVPDMDLVPTGQWYAAHPLDARLTLRADPTPADDLREDFRARSEVLARRIQGALSAALPAEARDSIERLDTELSRYIASVNDDLKAARGATDPATCEILAALRGQARQLREHAERTLARRRIRLMIAEGQAEEPDLFSSSAALVALGTKEDAALLREAKKIFDHDFLLAHAGKLWARAGGGEPPPSRP